MFLKLFFRVLWRIFLKLQTALSQLIFSIKWTNLNRHNRTLVKRKFPINCVQVGKRSYGELNVYSYANGANEKLVIGEYVSIANNVSFILGGNHNIDTFTSYPLKDLILNQKFQDAFSKGPIVIEDEVWIGFGATILSGVKVGKGAIIAAGAVVTKDIAPYSIVGGNPAKVLKYRFPENVIDCLTTLRLAEFEDKIGQETIALFYDKITDLESLEKNLQRLGYEKPGININNY